jgi:hypothetical protein
MKNIFGSGATHASIIAFSVLAELIQARKKKVSEKEEAHLRQLKQQLREVISSMSFFNFLFSSCQKREFVEIYGLTKTFLNVELVHRISQPLTSSKLIDEY